ncbi:MAG TPA: M1 family aminopeptidase, partial [Gemmatimonadaceae bacterium]|nr:M1 family aminopeptidase [Gemmatimonadaceae bacterium]
MMSLAFLLAALTAFPLSPHAAGTGSAADSLMGPGVSVALARDRAARVSNVRYELALDVTATDSAVGRLTARFTLSTPGDLILDFRGPSLRRMRINGVTPAAVEFNGHHVRIPGNTLVVGSNRVDFEFTAAIAAAGASIIRVRDPSDGATYLYTLLVPSDAQLLFPCFDQPDLKARVTLTLVTPMSWKAVANGALLTVDASSRGTTHAFRETAPISTYLIAFAAGPWATLTSDDSRRPITLYVRQSRAREVEVDSIIADNDRALDWLERYFASPYPFGKLDLVLAPAFPFSGMEHPGAVFYSEERFVFREAPTLPQRLGRTATIYHEIAHQWFGDLVTMKWFDDLWLKEGFATYMAARMQAALDPAAEAWKTFHLRNKPPAYAVDMTEGTTPVWQRLGNLDQAKSNYGAIVYNKAPSVLKQLEHLVGSDAFQGGIQRFIKQYAFGNATWRELLDAIGAAGNRPLQQWGEEYILRPGLPVLEQHVETRDGRVTRYVIVQRPAQALSGPRPWPIRTELVLAGEAGGLTRIPLILSADTTVVEQAHGLPVPAWSFANHGDAAYGLVMLDPGSVAWLEHSIGSVGDSFTRAMLWGALWDLVRESRLSPERFVRMALRELPAETDEQIAAVLLGRLTRASSRYLGRVQRDAMLPDVERVLLQVASDSNRPYGIRRTHLDALVQIAGTPPLLDSLASLLAQDDLSGLPIGAPTRWAIVTRLVATGRPAADSLVAAMSARDSTPEGARRAFVARAAAPDPEVKARYFARYFEDGALNED